MQINLKIILFLKIVNKKEPFTNIAYILNQEVHCIRLCWIAWIQYRIKQIQIDRQSMHQASPFSKKDGQYIQQQFKSIIDNYYDSSTAQTQAQIICLNALIVESVSSAWQIDSQQIIPKLEVLKIKSKSKPNLLSSITLTVQHLKSPASNKLKAETIQACMQHKELVEVCCLVLQRLVKSKLKDSMGIQQICRVCKKVFEGCVRWKFHVVMLDTLIQILNNFRNLPLQSGLDESARFLLSTQTSTIASSKPQTQKLIRLVAQACQHNPSLIHTYQTQLATLLYMQPSIIFQLQQILSVCYNQAHCSKFLSAHKIDNANIDNIYVWSHSSMFCIEATQSKVQQLENALKSEAIKPDLQYKIYVTINNFVVVNDFSIEYAWKMPRNLSEKVVNAYLILISNVLAHSSNADKQKEKLNLAAMQKIFLQHKLDSQATKKLMRDVKQNLTSTYTYSHLSFAKKLQQKTSSSSSSTHNQFIMETLLQKANKIPKSDEDLKITHEILSYSPKSDDPMEIQNLRSIKNRALDSLKISLLQSQSLYFQKIFNFLQLQIYDIYTLKRLLQIANFQLKINPKAATVINVYHLGKIILKIQEKDHDILDFQQLAEIFYICLGGQHWENNGKNKQQWTRHVIQRIREIKEEDYKINKQNISFQDTVDHITNLISNVTINEQQNSKQTKQDTNTAMVDEKQQKQPKQFKHSKVQTPSSKIQTPVKQNKQQNYNRIPSIIIPPPSPSSIIQPSQVHPPSVIIVQQQQQPKMKPPSEIDFAAIAAASNKLKQGIRTYNFLETNANLSIKNIILKYKIKDAVKKWIKRAKKSKQRLYKLREWEETEKNYMKKLLVLRDEIQGPLLKNQLINQLQASMIFPNLDAMIKLCDEMNVKISQLLQTWNPITTQLAPSLKSVTNFLKIYKNYSQNYDKSYQMMKKLAEDPEYSKCVKVVNIDNYLFSPVQRFQKYHLFVSEYLRNLPPGHRDLAPLQVELNFLLKVTDEINQFMELQNRAKKMVEMQKKFGNVVSNARQYKIQFTAFCFQFKCKIYGFNDLLIVAKINQYNTQQLYMRIKLCGKSVTWRQADCKSFKNRLFICGLDTSIHLTFQNLADVQNAHKFINGIIQTLYQNDYKRLDLIYQAQSRIKTGQSARTSKFQIDFELLDSNKYQRLELSAQVVGIDKMFYHGVLQTYFIIKARITKPYEICQVLYCELGILDDLEKHLQMLYPNIKCPSLEIKNKDVTSDDLTKVGEYLCVVIEKFLNFVIRNKTIMQRPERVLFKLGLHESLWAFLQTNKSQIQCSCEVCIHAQIYTDVSYYQKQRKLIQSNGKKFCILNSFNTQNTIRSMLTKQHFQDLSVQLKLVWALNKMHRIDHRLQPSTTFGKPIPMRVCVKMLSDDVVIDVKNMTIYTTCREVIEQVCARLRIETKMDLALVFAQDENQLIIDDDQYLIDFVKLVQEAEEEQKKVQANRQNSGRFSFFSRLSSFNSQQPKKYKKLQFCLRKVICLPFSEEEKQVQQNLERSRFIAGQILRKFQNHIMFLSVQDCRLLCGLIYSIQNFSNLTVQKKVNFKQQKLKKYLPQSKWDIITKDFIDKTIHIIQNQIESTDKIGVLYRALLKSFWLKYSFQFFPVQNTEPSELLGNFKSLYVGVNYKKITVTRKQTSVSLLEYPISDLKYRVYADSLFVQSEEKEHCFKASNLFILDKIIKTYRVIHEFQQ